MPEPKLHRSELLVLIEDLRKVSVMPDNEFYKQTNVGTDKKPKYQQDGDDVVKTILRNFLKDKE